jgi:hypothetical protein
LKAQVEIDWVIGREQVPELRDRGFLLCTDAVFQEIIRYRLVFLLVRLPTAFNEVNN